eukprot:Gb_11953 [translate_table: standard]
MPPMAAKTKVMQEHHSGTSTTCTVLAKDGKALESRCRSLMAIAVVGIGSSLNPTVGAEECWCPSHSYPLIEPSMEVVGEGIEKFSQWKVKATKDFSDGCEEQGYSPTDVPREAVESSDEYLGLHVGSSSMLSTCLLVKDLGRQGREHTILGRYSSHLKIDIVGLPNVGKFTLFNTLTKLSVPAENFPFCTIESNEARVNVLDKRFEWLCRVYKSKSKVSAFLEVHGIARLVWGAHQGQGLGNNFLSHICAVDGIFHVCRAFDDPYVIHVEDSVLGISR